MVQLVQGFRDYDNPQPVRAGTLGFGQRNRSCMRYSVTSRRSNPEVWLTVPEGHQYVDIFADLNA